jgi:hypothetical protein
VPDPSPRSTHPAATPPLRPPHRPPPCPSRPGVVHRLLPASEGPCPDLRAWPSLLSSSASIKPSSCTPCQAIVVVCPRSSSALSATHPRRPPTSRARGHEARHPPAVLSFAWPDSHPLQPSQRLPGHPQPVHNYRSVPQPTPTPSPPTVDNGRVIA